MAGTARPRPSPGRTFARPTALRYSNRMTHVATLISNSARPTLDEAHVAVAVGVLATAQAPRVLDPGIAVDIPFTPGGADDKAVAERLRTALKDAAVDVV